MPPKGGIFICGTVVGTYSLPRARLRLRMNAGFFVPGFRAEVARSRFQKYWFWARIVSAALDK